MSEKVSYHVPEFIPEPYQTYIRERNGNVAGEVAVQLGLLGKVLIGNLEEYVEGDYFLPSKTVKSGGVFDGLSEERVYGVVASEYMYGDKICLHRVISTESVRPDSFSDEFAGKVRDAVLPGFSVFDRDDCLDAYKELVGQGHRVLLKNPLASDFDGQCVVQSEEELRRFVEGYGRRNMHINGLVVEAFLREPVTNSYGKIRFGGKDYSFHAVQYDVDHAGRMKFGGGLVSIRRDDGVFENRIGHVSAEKARVVLDAYSHLVKIASRYSVDVVSGVSGKGDKLSGVTDITARPGGFTPGEMVGIEYLEDSGEDSVEVEVLLDYDPKKSEPKGKVFLDTETLRITAEVKNG